MTSTRLFLFASLMAILLITGCGGGGGGEVTDAPSVSALAFCARLSLSLSFSQKNTQKVCVGVLCVLGGGGKTHKIT